MDDVRATPEPSAPPPKPSAPPPDPARAMRTTEADRPVAYGTLIGTLALALATFALAFVAHLTDEKIGRQLSAFERTLSLMENDQRPWVHLSSINLTSPLVVTENNARVTIQFSLKNSGKSPAHFVTTLGFLGSVVQNNSSADLNQFWASCDVLRSKPVKELTGAVLFPGSELPYTNFAEMDATNVHRWRTGGVGVLLTFGCVDYLYADMRDHHQTKYCLCDWEEGNGPNA